MSYVTSLNLKFSLRVLKGLTLALRAHPTSGVENGTFRHLSPTETHNGKYLLLRKAVHALDSLKKKKEGQCSLQLFSGTHVFSTPGSAGFYQP